MRTLKLLPVLFLVLAGVSLAEETRTPPVYPRDAIIQCLSGYVTMELTFGDGGAIESVVVIESSPKGVFDEAAVQAVRQWRLDPAIHPKGSKYNQSLNFEIPKNVCPNKSKA